MGNWIIRASMCYEKGSIRKNNEDAYYFNGRYASLSKMDKDTSMAAEVSAPGSLWAVCDGMGGQSNGEKASFTAVSGMPDLQQHLRGRDFEATIQSWVHQANRAVSERAEGGGSTLAMVYCADQYLQTAHIGDSRIYRYHNGELIRITKDHSKVEMLLEAKMITPEEALHHPQKNVITRYLGMNSDSVCDATVGKKPPFCSGDRYLICSDGVTDMLTDAKITELLSESGEVAACTEKIKEAVLEAGAVDNMTVILLELAALDQMDTLRESEALLPDHSKAGGPEQPGTDCQVRIQISPSANCEVVVHGNPSKVSLNIE